MHSDLSKLASNPRASFSAWTRYAPFVYAAFRLHPQPYAFTPKNLSPASVCSKLRDAIRGCIEFSYASDVSTSDLRNWWEETSVTFTLTEVIIGPKRRLGLPAVAVLSLYTYPTLSPNEVRAFLVLLSTGRIRGPITVVSPPEMDIPRVANVEVVKRSDGTLILI